LVDLPILNALFHRENEAPGEGSGDTLYRSEAEVKVEAVSGDGEYGDVDGGDASEDILTVAELECGHTGIRERFLTL